MGFDLRKNIFQDRIEVAYGSRFKYGHLYYDFDLTSGIKRSVNAITTDHLLSINGRFPVGDEREIRVGIGLGYMRRGSAYLITTVDTLSNGQQIAVSTEGDFKYRSNFVSASYIVNRLEGGVISYYTTESHYDQPSPFLSFAFFLKYEIWE